MRPPPSPRKSGDSSKALQLYGGKAQPARELQLIPAMRSPDSEKHSKDPLYIGWVTFNDRWAQGIHRGSNAHFAHTVMYAVNVNMKHTMYHSS